MASYIDHEGVQMIIMGSNGASGWQETFFGSNAQKVIRFAHCPVLVIKHAITKHPVSFRNIVFASDFEDQAIDAFDRLVEFGRHFGSRIHLLHVASYPEFDVSEEALMRMDRFVERCRLPVFKHGRGDINIEKGIEHFAIDNKADLVAVAHYGHQPFERMFNGSVSESLVNHLELPVLVLNTEENVPNWQEFVDPNAAGIWAM
ncbi:MAG: universal stress protein [Bacteroidota bacterium]